MAYLQTEIIRPLYGNVKRISSSTLKVGDRFFIEGSEGLWFKLNVPQTNKQYLCCNESGVTRLIDGDVKVTRINGIRGAIAGLSKQIVQKYLEKETESK